MVDFRFQRKFITVEADGADLRIQARGPQLHVMGFEIYVLYIVNELYFRRFDQGAAWSTGRARLAERIVMLRILASGPGRQHPFEFFDFGVRRRFSGTWQEETAVTAAGQCVTRRGGSGT